MTAFVDKTIQEVRLLPRDEQEALFRALLDIVTPTKESIIRCSPGVVGGRARIRDMRIPVSLIVSWYNAGWSDQEVLDNYPGLKATDLDAVKSYYVLHQEEINAEIEEE